MPLTLANGEDPLLTLTLAFPLLPPSQPEWPSKKVALLANLEPRTHLMNTPDTIPLGLVACASQVLNQFISLTKR